MTSHARALSAEFAGAAFLLMAVVGSGHMAESLTGDTGLALLCNAVATGAALYVLIVVLGPVSGAHFNPAVSLVFALRRELPWQRFACFVPAQICGAILGVWIAHLMFDLPMLQTASTARTGAGQWLAEGVATFGLIAAIVCTLRHRAEAVAGVVGLYITAAYWFTASTSFANPAVTIARALSDTFAGIQPAHMPAFIAVQLVAASLAAVSVSWLLRADTDTR